MPWDYTKTEYERQAKTDLIWGLERLINYGLQGKKLNKILLAKYLHELRIPENRKAFLELLLWNKSF
jgi:hypothetical protein